jgi:hypothetical protein
VISKIIIKNFRKFRECEINLNPDVNILVGANESGKTTILDAINLALTGRINGRWARDELNPYWFNQQVVHEYFTEYKIGKRSPFPVIEIELYLDESSSSETQSKIAQLRGKNNSLRRDCSGLCIRVEPDPDFEEELNEYMQVYCTQNGSKNALIILPTDYYRISWHSFQSKDQIWHKPKGIGVAHINTKTLQSTTGVDYHTRQLLAESVDKSDSAKLSSGLRSARALLTSKYLKKLNDHVNDITNMDHDILGVQIDQSASANWEKSITPQISDIPFSLCGQGQQVAAKVELAMMHTSNNTNIVLVEEPENHLSHTRLRRIISRIQELSCGRQLIITTHSSYVLNRLGIDKYHLVSSEGSKVAKMDQLNEQTVCYFKKQAGFDTLRVILGDKVVIVEGPSDDLILQKAIFDETGVLAEKHGIDIITLNGVPFKRWLDLANLVEKKIVAIRDNDGQEPSYWNDKFKESMGDNGKLFVGEPGKGHTLEPQLIEANADNVKDFITYLGLTKYSGDLEDWMLKNKTESALRIMDIPAGKVQYPAYIKEAIKELCGDE